MVTDLPRPLFSRCYRRLSPRMEEAGMAGLRRELLAGARGGVVEVGCGNGLNFGHYPETVTRVVAVEPEPGLRAAAGQAAREARVAVEVRAGTAEQLPVESGSADVAVLCLVLCSVRGRAAALGELRRVLRPGGELRFLEHTIAEDRRLRVVQRIADATLWPLLAGGCHTATDPLGDVERAGFAVQRVRRFDFPELAVRVPASPHVLGVAVAGG
ncbi:ubiquinone/menaquinone biosynthesis C-methylase UbiE [Geodermatophilus bullaregiensis]|uniref:class I SAM-dependent methyltransferase n=1 Tax=Geodermatophilus bullaregiensis TaxID=1564160 RepID=UPI0027DB697D|nr:methyltransferase domain-containing protein [Geodermatophilus bullaregiensis]MBM7806688.1 ubiquinone/menaquinone biosynthesis C-methylase UbiE [Geodermatophilus bullaregiensis]